jgi:predicted RNase H-like nuclease (RuvC/YqgF family)
MMKITRTLQNQIDEKNEKIEAYGAKLKQMKQRADADKSERRERHDV